MSLARSSHGSLLFIELDILTPGVFTAIAELNGDIKALMLQRPWDETTPHNDDIDSGVTGRLGRGEYAFSINFIHDDPTHDHLTGLQAKIIDQERFGMMYRSPTGSAGDDEIIQSGEIINIDRTNPVRQGAQTANVTFRASKAMIIDGVTVGSAA